MYKKRYSTRKEHKLCCPVCREPMDNLNTRDVGPYRVHLSPQPTDLTECGHCKTMLEYAGDQMSLTLRLAPQARVDRFNELTREGPHEPSVPELIEYVRKYRRMPPRPSLGYRFRKPLERH